MLKTWFHNDREDLLMGDRTIPFYEDLYCDVCGAQGAFDFMGDVVCGVCANNDSSEDDIPEAENGWYIWKHKTATEPEIRYYVKGNERQVVEDWENDRLIEVRCIRNYARSDSGHTWTLQQAPRAGYWPASELLHCYAEEKPYTRPEAVA